MTAFAQQATRALAADTMGDRFAVADSEFLEVRVSGPGTTPLLPVT